MEILIVLPVLFLVYLVILLVNSCAHREGHDWKPVDVDCKNYECTRCKQKRNRNLFKIWKR